MSPSMAADLAAANAFADAFAASSTAVLAAGTAEAATTCLRDKRRARRRPQGAARDFVDVRANVVRPAVVEIIRRSTFTVALAEIAVAESRRIARLEIKISGALGAVDGA